MSVSTRGVFICTWPDSGSSVFVKKMAKTVSEQQWKKYRSGRKYFLMEKRFIKIYVTRDNYVHGRVNLSVTRTLVIIIL